MSHHSDRTYSCFKENPFTDIMNHKDLLSTVVGLVVGITGVLTSNGYIESRIGGTVVGCGTVILGYLIKSPDT
jgi:hypothetical protein